MNSMTPKERWLASVKLQPVDRLVYWPKLDAAYPGNQKLPFREWTNEQIHAWMGTDMRYGVEPVFKEVTHRSQKQVVIDDKYRRITYTTPTGVAEQVSQYDAASVSWHPVQFPIRDLQTLQVMVEFYSDLTVELDRNQLEIARRIYREVGEKGIVGTAIGESPLMHFVEWLAGIKNAHFFLADNQEEVEALFKAIHRVLLREAEIMGGIQPGRPDHHGRKYLDHINFSYPIPALLLYTYQGLCYHQPRRRAKYGTAHVWASQSAVAHAGRDARRSLRSLHFADCW
jgi:hypothetical protein